MAYNSNDIPKHAGVVIDKAAAVRIATSIGWEPKRTWVGLTVKEKSELWEVSRAALPRYATYASLVEAKLKEKNSA